MSARTWLVAVAALAATVLAGPAQAEGGGNALRLGEFELRIHAPYRPLVALPGIDGPAYRFDGNSTWAETRAPVELPLAEGFAVSAWVALASPPVVGAMVVHLNGPEGEIRLGVGPWLEPEFQVGDLRAASFEALELGRWTHLAGTFDGEATRLYVNGALVGESAGETPDLLTGGLAVGRNIEAGLRYETHQLGVWNGLIGSLDLQLGEPLAPAPGAAPSDAPLDVPAEWFEGDLHRPAFHPMPPAGWTNEPHALSWEDGAWHLYHQANPNGAFWEHIVWGHMVSQDLVSWEVRPPALIPGTGFDRRGVWVGNPIPETQPSAILYTGVNGERSGLGRAVRQSDGSFSREADGVAYATPQGYQDMRDPWVVRTDEGWLALVGSGTSDHTAPLILAWTSEDSHVWSFVGEFDTGGTEMPGEYWEVPVLMPIAGRWLLMGTPVLRDAPTRTLYWIGEFDGTRFVPDDPMPQQYDLFGTLLAPSLAEDDAGRMIAIGVIPDDGQRPEPERRRAGWVHALSVPVEVTLCAEASRLCQSFASEVPQAFTRQIMSADSRDLAGQELSVDLGHDPVYLAANFRVPQDGEVEIGLRASPDGSETTRLVLRPSQGEVVLDTLDSSLEQWSRADLRESNIAAGEEVRVELIVDRAAISGTIGGHAFGVLIYPKADDATLLTIRGEGSARLVQLDIMSQE